MPLKFKSWDAYFIVFKEIATKTSLTIAPKIETEILKITSPWKLSIAGKSINLSSLSSWTDNQDIDIKYFSGTASYLNTLKLDNIKSTSNYVLELGNVKNVAEVIVNGKNMGTIWKTPFNLNISSALKNGENTLEISVTNTWVNRLVGDAQPGVQKTTFTTMQFYNEKSALMPAGLLGEVRLLEIK